MPRTRVLGAIACIAVKAGVARAQLARVHIAAGIVRSLAVARGTAWGSAALTLLAGLALAWRRARRRA